MVSSWLTRAACALLCVASAAWETFSPRDASHFETERVDSPPVSRRSISERRRELQAKHLGTGTEPCHGSVMGGLTRMPYFTPRSPTARRASTPQQLHAGHGVDRRVSCARRRSLPHRACASRSDHSRRANAPLPPPSARQGCRVGGRPSVEGVSPVRAILCRWQNGSSW